MNKFIYYLKLVLCFILFKIEEVESTDLNNYKYWLYIIKYRWLFKVVFRRTYHSITRYYADRVPFIVLYRKIIH